MTQKIENICLLKSLLFPQTSLIIHLQANQDIIVKQLNNNCD